MRTGSSHASPDATKQPVTREGDRAHGRRSADVSRSSNVRASLAFLLQGSAASVQPTSLRLRTFLSTTRYILRFVFWRLVRYTKYALIGAASAWVAGSVAAPLVPIVGAIVMPSMPVAMALGAGAAVLRFGWRHRGNHFRQGWLVGGQGRDAHADEQADAHAHNDRAAPSTPIALQVLS